MVSICFRTFKECLPEVGRKVIVWGNRTASFDSSYIGQIEGRVNYRELDDGEGGWYEAFCIGEYEVGDWDLFVTEGVGVNDYWTYADDIHPVLFPDYFYEDWIWYCQKGHAKMKCLEASEVFEDKHGNVHRFIDYEFEMNGQKWKMSFNYKYLYKVEKI
jgi:hypothetical protein